MIAYFFIAAGAFAVVCAIGNWDWFMDHPKARFFVKILSRTGARILYILIGSALIALGTCGLLGIIDLSK